MHTYLVGYDGDPGSCLFIEASSRDDAALIYTKRYVVHEADIFVVLAHYMTNYSVRGQPNLVVIRDEKVETT